MIAVSHDRYFLRRIATRIVTVDSGKLVDYQGDYEVWGRGRGGAQPWEAAAAAPGVGRAERAALPAAHLAAGRWQCACCIAPASGLSRVHLCEAPPAAAIDAPAVAAAAAAVRPLPARGAAGRVRPAARQADTYGCLPPNKPPLPSPCLLQLFLEQNEDEAEKMEAKEEKQREIEKSQIKVRRGGGGAQGAVAATDGGRQCPWPATGERWYRSRPNCCCGCLDYAAPLLCVTAASRRSRCHAAAVAASMLCRPSPSCSRRPQAKSKMSKAEKAKAKKDKAKAFNQAPSAAGKPAKNAKRWN